MKTLTFSNQLISSKGAHPFKLRDASVEGGSASSLLEANAVKLQADYALERHLRVDAELCQLSKSQAVTPAPKNGILAL